MAKADLIAKAEELNLELTGEETVAELETLLLANEPTPVVGASKSKFNCDNCEDSGLECLECGAGR